MEPKSQPKVNVFLVRFWNGSGNIDGTAAGLRRVCGEAAGGTLSPADPPGRPSRARGYQTKTGKEGWLAGSNTPRAVGSANFCRRIVGVFADIPWISGSSGRKPGHRVPFIKAT